MEIETKIFDVKKIRKVLKKNDISAKRICDVVDFLFDASHFSPKEWNCVLPKGNRSGLLGLGTISVEVPDIEALRDIQDFVKNRYETGSKVRLRLVDDVPYLTLKGPKKARKGIKSREEIETRIGSLSSMMKILLMSGANIVKSVARVREVYTIPEYAGTELIIDTFDFANGALEYAEIECPSEDALYKVLKKVFKIDIDIISDAGITGLHKEKIQKSVSQKIEKLKELIID